MHRLTSFARGAAGVGAIVAYQVGAHYAAATPGAHGVGLAMALLPPLAIALVAGREPLCTRFAHMVHGTLTPRIARYSRQVTLVWTLFFLATAAVSTLLFATASTVTWSTFANYLSLPLVGVVFVAEYLCRRIVLLGEPHSSLFDAVRAYRQSEQSGHVTPAATERSR